MNLPTQTVTTSTIEYRDQYGNIIYNPSYTSGIDTYPYKPAFEQLAKTFGLPITQEQIQTLEDLFNSGDESNKIIACETFKYLLSNNKDLLNNKAL